MRGRGFGGVIDDDDGVAEEEEAARSRHWRACWRDLGRRIAGACAGVGAALQEEDVGLVGRGTDVGEEPLCSGVTRLRLLPSARASFARSGEGARSRAEAEGWLEGAFDGRTGRGSHHSLMSSQRS